ncbi:MAG: helix-turn-helix domain-containing protein [Planctomycetota bacterium]|nr:MAG: helix-turn-helix domain-containing protein [Planctomycetota bacterium]KAB2948216.1 MAG: helix-turn-helix domain-containing protein [Phycisphaerae bacterium]MCQ3921506.1 hypothetical protein [Planctomycetota bacterium]
MRRRVIIRDMSAPERRPKPPSAPVLHPRETHARLADLIARRSRETFGQRVRRLRRRNRWTQAEFARRAGINQGFLSQIERDRKSPSAQTLDAMAVALGVPQGVLLGSGEDHDAPQPLQTKELPLFGSVPGGPPSQTQEQLEMFPVLRHLWASDHYCLRLTYDSMEPTLKPGDIVLVRYSPGVEPEHVQGKICACLVDGQSTLKRVNVELRQGRRVVLLRGDNPRIPPATVDEAVSFSIQGVVLKLVARDL